MHRLFIRQNTENLKKFEKTVVVFVFCSYKQIASFHFTQIKRVNSHEKSCGFHFCGNDAFFYNNAGSVLSEGNIWLIVAVAIVALAGVAALVIVKKKRNPQVRTKNKFSAWNDLDRSVK